MINLSGYKNFRQIYESQNSLVFRAVRDKDNHAVVLKVLKKDYPCPEELLRYRQEYDITRRLAGLDGVINAYSLEKYQNTLVMNLEDFGGESFKILQDRQRVFTLEELLSFAIRIVEILGQIHGQNIIHKDINPSNIVLNPDSGVLKIIDFGISSQLSRQHLNLKNPESLEGTIAYMSPEQTGRMNRALDYRTDFYSLGATLYELFTGVVPFATKDAMELIHCHIAEQPIPPIHMNPDLPPVISDLVIKLLKKTVEERYQSAWGIRADLEACMRTLRKTGHIAPFTLAQKDFSERFQIPQKLYGREREADILHSAFDRVADGKTEIMMVSGFSGIGKSVLVKEIYKSLTEKKGYFISGKFDQFQKSRPYSALLSAFKELIRQLLTENETHLLQWKDRLLRALGPNGQVIIDVLPEVELIIGPQPALLHLGATESENRFNIVLQSFIYVFTQPEQPLVLFLDDLQWVDAVTLKLLESVIAEKQDTALFFIGAYRDNEVDPAHPLLCLIDKLRKGNITINQIILKPFAFENTQQLIADCLHQDLHAAESLTELVMRKTGGNPFFINQFLQTLYEKDLFHFIPPAGERQGYWQWDIEHVESLSITDNVVELIIGKLKRLPESVQYVLSLAACEGNLFDLDTLSIIYGRSTADTFNDLRPVLAEGFILPVSDPELAGHDIRKSPFIIRHMQFLHDRVQQSAYALIDDEQKQSVHLKIGRLLLKNTSDNDLEKKIFHIVGHFNHSADLISDPAEQLKIARLNLMAGQKAKMATAYKAAADYFTIGRTCLSNNSWENEYDLTLSLYEDATEAAYLNGDFEQMDKLAQVVLKQAQTLSDEVKICEIQILAYAVQHQLEEAINTALFYLKRLGINFPEELTDGNIGLEIHKIQVSLSGKKIKDLIDLPVMTETNMILAMRIMPPVIPAAYYTSPGLMALLVLKQVELSLEYGNASESSFSYVFYGVILCSVLGDIESGYKFGQLALDLMDRMNVKKHQAGILQVFYTLVMPWKKHARKGLQPLLKNFQFSLDLGSIDYAALSIHTYYCNSFFTGKSLITLEPEIARYDAKVAQLVKAGVIDSIRRCWQVVLNLVGHSDHPCLLVGDVYDETHMLSFYQKNNDKASLCLFYLYKSVLHYLFQEYAQAAEVAEIAGQNLDGNAGMITVPVYYFYDSLIRLAVYPDLPLDEQVSELEKVTANQEKMKNWAYHAPMNFQHKYDLVEAERARVLGRDGDAREFYDTAIALAHKNEYLNEEALAYELAGRFYLAKGQTRFARVCFFEAHYAYQQWGATAKVNHLKKEYPQFLAAKTADPVQADFTISTVKVDSASTIKEPNHIFDVESIMKASRAFSGEIVLSRLLEKVMRIVIENAGAEKGFLLFSKEDKWFIEAEGNVDSSNMTVLESLPLEESEQLPASIINFVARTRENVVLDHAPIVGLFTTDPIIQKRSLKSVLCLPLINQGQVSGILYLENNLVDGAFTLNRVKLLNLLSSQIAMALDNAKLYNHLEERIAKRTIELEAAKNKAQQYLDIAGVIIIAVNVNHEIILINQKGCEALGIPAQEGVGKNWFESFIPEAFRPELIYTFNRVMAGELPNVEYFENPILTRDGKQRLIAWNNTLLKDDNGIILGSLSSGEDITKRKDMEEALKSAKTNLERRVKERTSELSEAIVKLKETELRYRTLADFTYDWSYWSAPDGQMNYVSPSCERISGYSAQEFIDKPPLHREIILPEDREIWDAHLRDARQYLKPMEIQFRIRTKNGDIRWIEHACQPVRDDIGSFFGFRVSNRDITERKQSEIALQNSEKNLGQAQRLTKMGNWQWDIHTNKLEWSDEVFRIFGFTPQAFSATYDAFLEQVHPDDRNSVESAVKKAIEEPFVEYDIQHRIVKADSSEGFVHEHAEVIFDENDQPVFMIGSVQDISDKKILELELQQFRSELAHLERVKTMGEMTAAIAHEINQPLTANRSYAQAALRFLDAEPPDLENIRKALKGVVTDNKRAADVINRIRALAMKEDSCREAFDISTVIKGVLNLINSEIVIRNISITTQLSRGLQPLYGDAIQIQQVTLNLLMNALDEMESQPAGARHIIISSKVEDKKGVIVSVSQSGPGILTGKIEKIFTPFYSTKPTGMGLGLTICRSIVENHGGELWAENLSQGGVRFSFNLPFNNGDDS